MQPSKRQRKLERAKSKSMTVGQLWRAREKQSRSLSGIRGRKGILVITPRRREKQGMTEFMSWMSSEEFADDDDEEEEEQGLDLQEELAKDIAKLKASKTRTFDVNMECLSLIAVKSDPVEIVLNLMDKIHQSGCCHVEKLVPFQRICEPNLSSVLVAFEELMHEDVMSGDGQMTFAIEAKVRGGASEELSRTNIIKAVANCVDKNRWSVNLTQPDVVVIVEVIRSIVGMSVLAGEQYRKHHKFFLKVNKGGEE